MKTGIDRILLLIYVCSVVALTFVHRMDVLLAIIALLCIASIPHTLRLVLRALLSVFFFASITTLGYAISQHLRGEPFVETLARINLRILCMTLLSFTAIQKINLFRAFSFSPGAIFFLTLVESQIHLYQMFSRDFRLALQSRSPERPTLIMHLRVAASAGRSVLLSAFHEAEERSQAMESRLYFENGPAE